MQYFYYSWRTHPGKTITGANARRVSIERGASRYRTLSAVAANVAATAALAAQQDNIDQRRRWQRNSIDRLPYGSSDRTVLGDRGDDEDIDESALAALADSFHSERGPGSGGNRVSWSIERHGRRSGSVGLLPGISRHPIPPPLQLTTEGLFDPTGRGRSLQRGVDLETEPEPDTGPHLASPNRRSSRASRRGATMVFLSAWALFGIGTLTGNIGDISINTPSGFGKVLAVQRLSMPKVVPVAAPERYIPPTLPVYVNGIRNLEAYETTPPPLEPPKESYGQRIIGRIFAWMCATLYLTSRLPQIWKNVRRSLFIDFMRQF